MERILHKLEQGSPEWHQFRAQHFGASEAAAMLGISKHKTRTDLLKEKSTGFAPDVDAMTQKRFDHGHDVEPLARPMVSALIGEELYPVTYSYGSLSASCDGLTMDGELAFEHKQWNGNLAAAVMNGELPEEHQPQCQQVMLVTGANKLLFVVSDGTQERYASVEVLPDTEWQSRLIAGWAQFEKDQNDYVPVEVIPAAVAAPIKDLPALTVEITGSVTLSNLPQWKAAVTERIEAINTDLQTDNDFADADKMVNFLDDGEKRIELVKAQAQSQVVSIDELYRTLDEVKALMQSTRLGLKRQVEAKKESIRAAIFNESKESFIFHVQSLNLAIGKPYMPVLAPDFAGAMKNKKTVSSLRNAADTELARAKIEADGIAKKIIANLASLRELAADHASLFPDTRDLVLKSNDDLIAVIKSRIADQKAEQEKKAEAERQRILKEQHEQSVKDNRAQIQTGIEAPKKIEADAKPPVPQAERPFPVSAWETAKREIIDLLEDLTLAQLVEIKAHIKREYREAA